MRGYQFNHPLNKQFTGPAAFVSVRKPIELVPISVVDPEIETAASQLVRLIRLNHHIVARA